MKCFSEVEYGQGRGTAVPMCASECKTFKFKLFSVLNFVKDVCSLAHNSFS